MENAGFLVSEKEGCFKLTQVKEREIVIGEHERMDDYLSISLHNSCI